MGYIQDTGFNYNRKLIQVQILDWNSSRWSRNC